MQREGHAEQATLGGAVWDRANQDHFIRKGQGRQTTAPIYSLPWISGWAPAGQTPQEGSLHHPTHEPHRSGSQGRDQVEEGEEWM